jgi:hypothetical protein
MIRPGDGFYFFTRDLSPGSSFRMMAIRAVAFVFSRHPLEK